MKIKCHANFKYYLVTSDGEVIETFRLMTTAMSQKGYYQRLTGRKLKIKSELL